MIATALVDQPPAAQLPGQDVRLVDVVEAQLDDDPVAPRPHAHLVAEGDLERVRRRLEGRGLLRIDRRLPRPSFWLASQPNPVLGFADRPSRSHRVAGEAAADVVAAGAEQGAAVTLAELSGLEQLQRLVGQLEQADQVGDGGAAAADPAGQLLFGQARGPRPGRRRRSPPRPG